MIQRLKRARGRYFRRLDGGKRRRYVDLEMYAKLGGIIGRLWLDLEKGEGSGWCAFDGNGK